MAVFPSYLYFAFVITVSAEFVWKHHSNEELPLVLEEIHENCPNITRVYALSEPSVRNVPLYVIEFSDNPGFHQVCKYLLNNFDICDALFNSDNYMNYSNLTYVNFIYN